MQTFPLDDATRTLIEHARLDGYAFVCIGTVADAACKDHLYRCDGCGAIGCRTPACSRLLYDAFNVCQRCQKGPRMNRYLRFSAAELVRQRDG